MIGLECASRGGESMQQYERLARPGALIGEAACESGWGGVEHARGRPGVGGLRHVLEVPRISWACGGPDVAAQRRMSEMLALRSSFGRRVEASVVRMRVTPWSATNSVAAAVTRAASTASKPSKTLGSWRPGGALDRGCARVARPPRRERRGGAPRHRLRRGWPRQRQQGDGCDAGW